MALQPGTSQFGPDRGRVILRTTRAGLAGAAGHDLTIEIGQWAGTLTVLADQSPASLEVRLEMGSLAVVAAAGGLKPLSDKDKREIAGTTRKVLGVQRHPQATFSAEKFEPGPDGGVISGSLTLAGNTRPLALQVASTGPDAYRATAAVRQTQFGIKPYSGLLGTLKVADVVSIEVDIDVSGLPAPRG